MNHEHPDDLLPGLALGALDAGDRSTVERHVRLCVRCQLAVESARAVAGCLGFAAPQQRPSPALRLRLLEHVAQESVTLTPPVAMPAQARLPWWLMAAAILPWLVALSVLVVLWPRQAPTPRLAVAAISGSSGAYGRLAMDPHGTSAFLMLTHMPRLPAGKTYVCWLQRSGTMLHACAFKLLPGSDDATVTLSMPRPLSDYTAIGVTMESNPSAQHPTGTILAAGTLLPRG